MHRWKHLKQARDNTHASLVATSCNLLERIEDKTNSEGEPWGWKFHVFAGDGEDGLGITQSEVKRVTGWVKKESKSPGAGVAAAEKRTEQIRVKSANARNRLKNKEMGVDTQNELELITCPHCGESFNAS